MCLCLYAASVCLHLLHLRMLAILYSYIQNSCLQTQTETSRCGRVAMFGLTFLALKLMPLGASNLRLRRAALPRHCLWRCPAAQAQRDPAATSPPPFLAEVQGLSDSQFKTPHDVQHGAVKQLSASRITTPLRRSSLPLASRPQCCLPGLFMYPEPPTALSHPSRATRPKATHTDQEEQQQASHPQPPAQTQSHPATLSHPPRATQPP